ncbi:MAG: FMN-binding protein, partial [Dermatophilaceae bacterium]|nr:FMN-binding protein [Dermatophilaceae bacterium]
VYNDEAVQAQSADIDVVSGATVTWEGYTRSLQSAIDRANI